MLDKEQFTALARRHMDEIFRLAFSWLKNRADADDVTQTALMRLWETDKQFESDEHLKRWLIRVAVNECKKHWRSPWRRTEDLEEFANTLAFEDGTSGEVLGTVMALDAKYRIVVFLYYYEGFSIDEIARLLRLPKGTVGTRLARARARLKDFLSEEEMK